MITTTNLKMLRAKFNLTQTDMANLLKVRVPTYCQKENGKKDFSLKEAKTIADHFNLSIDYIFFGNDFFASKNECV